MSGTLNTIEHIGSGSGISGSDSGTDIVAGGMEYLGFDYGTGTATSTTIDNGGEQSVGDDYGTGTANSTTIDNGGEQSVGDDYGTGTANSTTISDGVQYVGNYYGTGTANSTTISDGGYQYVGHYYGTGTANNTTIDSGGNQIVGDDYGTGTANSTTISDGVQYVGNYYGTGTANSTTIDSGGYQYVGDGSGATGIATSTTLSGGTQYVSSGGTATDTTVYSGGFADVLSGGVVNAPVIDGGTLELAASASFGTGGIDFSAVSGANGGVLDLTGEGSGLTFTPVISGFTGTGDTTAFSDVIEVTGTGDVGDKVVWTQSGASGTLQVETSEGTVLQTLTLDGTYFHGQFTLTDSTNIDEITYNISGGTGVTGGGTLNTTEYIGSGSGVSGSDSGTTIVSGGVEYLGYDFGTGTAISTTIASGGSQFVGDDNGTGTATGTTIDSGGSQYVGYDGIGYATSTTISGGIQYVGYDSGTGTATSTKIESGGQQNVGDYYGTGYATNTTIESGSNQFVGIIGGTGTATRTTIESGGTQYVGFRGIGKATSTTVDNGGYQVVGDGSGAIGTATSTTIESGGYQDVGYYSGTGTATSTTIDSGGSQSVGHDGIGYATNTTISGGIQYVGYGSGTGTATSTTIASGGQQYVGNYDGVGYATNTTIESGGAQYVGDGSGAIGTATSTTIDSGGYQYVGDGSGATGTATSTTLSGGTQYVSSGGTATDTTVYSGGLADILSGGVVNAPVIDGGTLVLASSASFGTGVIDFSAVSGANGGTLDLTGEGSGLTFTPMISGFTGTGDTAALSDIIKVVGVAATDHVVWTQDGASGTLHVETSGGTVLETLTLDGTYLQTHFQLNDISGDDSITYDSNPLCYCRGVRILTDKGEVAIEWLAIGDRVVSASGEVKLIRWIGHRRVDIGRHPRPQLVRPVRISANALGDGLPARDLLVSPEHALWLREALVPARELINGATIRQEAWSRVEYFHLELDSHEILLAEGVPAESYLDCDNRQGFENAPDGVVRLNPDWRRQASTRRFASPAQTAALRADFAARAVTFGRGVEIETFAAEQRVRAKVTRTNFVRNPRAEGSISGVLGAGGRAPTHWWLSTPNGVAVEVIDAGDEAGLPFLDLRFAGVAKASGICGLHPEPGTAASARPGQEWTISCYLRQVAGGFDGIEGVNLYIDECGANGAYLDGQDYPQPLPTADALALQRWEATRKMSRPDVAGMTGYLQIKVAVGAPIDLTLRVASLQIERGDYASNLILPPPGKMRASTRDEASFSQTVTSKVGFDGLVRAAGGK